MMLGIHHKINGMCLRLSSICRLYMNKCKISIISNVSHHRSIYSVLDLYESCLTWESKEEIVDDKDDNGSHGNAAAADDSDNKPLATLKSEIDQNCRTSKKLTHKAQI